MKREVEAGRSVRIRRKERGFTLMEGMISVSILAYALLAISTGEIQALQSNKRSLEKLRAVAAAEEVIELMRRNDSLGAKNQYTNLNTSEDCPAVPVPATLFSDDCSQWKERVAEISGVTATEGFACGGALVTTACGFVAIGAGAVGLPVGLSTVSVTVVWPGNTTGVTVNTTIEFNS